MSVMTYLLVFFGALLLMYAVSGTYFVIRQLKTYMTVLDPFTSLEMRQLGTIIALCFAVGVGIFYWLMSDKSWFMENSFLSVCFIAVGMAVIGLISDEKMWGRCLRIVLQFAGVCTALSLFPKESALFTVTGLPFEANLALVGAAWTTFLGVLSILNRLNGYFVQQFLSLLIFGVVALLFYPAFQEPLFLLLLLTGTIGLGALPFFLTRASIPLLDSVRIFFNFVFSWFVVALIVSGKTATGVLLAAYPLVESVVFAARWFVMPITKKPVSFLFQNIEARTSSPYFTVLYIFKRNFIYCLLAAIAVNAQTQIQPIILGVIISCELCLRFIGGATRSENQSWKGVFRQVKSDIKVDYQNSKKQFKLLKEKLVQRKAAKSHDKE